MHCAILFFFFLSSFVCFRLPNPDGGINSERSTCILNLLSEHNIKHCVVAVGYERDSGLCANSMRIIVEGRQLTEQDLDGYDRMTGQIVEGVLLFGGGIAFPQDLIDGGGNKEPWVGFKRSIEQVDLMVDVLNKK